MSLPPSFYMARPTQFARNTPAVWGYMKCPGASYVVPMLKRRDADEESPGHLPEETAAGGGAVHGGGSGDVLAGIIASLLGHGLAPLEAAACGAWLHGAAGDICAAEIGQYGMLPSDMLEVLPRLMK